MMKSGRPRAISVARDLISIYERFMSTHVLGVTRPGDLYRLRAKLATDNDPRAKRTTNGFLSPPPLSSVPISSNPIDIEWDTDRI